MGDLQVVYSRVEPIGPIRPALDGSPIDMEFVLEVVRAEDVIVDALTQEVLAESGGHSLDVSWLHPRARDVDVAVNPDAYVAEGLLPALTNAANLFYVVVETCAGLFALEQHESLRTAAVVGYDPTVVADELAEAMGAYGCRTWGAYSRVDPRFVLVGSLLAPRFWIRPAGSGQEHFEAPRWAAAGYSREFLADLRSRFLPVPGLEADVIAVDTGGLGSEVEPTLSTTDLRALAQDRAVVWPDMSALSMEAQARAYSRIDHLVGVHSDATVNVVFAPAGALVDEVFLTHDAPGHFGILAELVEVDYRGTVCGDGSPQTGGAPGATIVGHVRTPRTERSTPGSTQEPVSLLTGVWDNADLLEDWLAHHLALGVAGVLAMDFGSTDGSIEILTSPRWRSFVTVMPFPGLLSDHSRDLVDAARADALPGWALLIDPDEFLVTPTGSIVDPILGGAMAAADLVVIPRFDFTAPRSVARAWTHSSFDTRLLDLCVAEQDQGKVLLRLESDASSSLSAHDGDARRSTRIVDPRACLLHAPVRSSLAYARKIDHAAETLEVNSHLDPGFAWHWRRAVDRRDRGLLEEDYLEQFVDDDGLTDLLARGTIRRDPRLADLLARARS